MQPNPVLSLFRKGRPALGTWATLVHHPKFMRLLAATGLDFVILEMEHTDFSISDVSAQALVARASGLAPIVRPPGLTKPHDLTRPLDAGAMGLLLPCVDTPEQLAAALSVTKYHPKGERILNFRGAHTDYRRLADPAEQIALLNAETMTIAMIESRDGLEALPEICAVDGLDAIMIGPDDLSQALGVPGLMKHERMEAARERVIEVCDEHDVPWGFSCADADTARHWMERGMRWVPLSNDANILFSAYADMVGALAADDASRPGEDR